jgi:hypothetical protein
MPLLKLSYPTYIHALCAFNYPSSCHTIIMLKIMMIMRIPITITKTIREVIMITTIKIMTEMRMINLISHFLAAEHWRAMLPSEHYFPFF